MASPQVIVDQLLALSEDPDNQSYIVRESGCLSGLVDYLSHSDAKVAYSAATAIWHLSSATANRDVVKAHPGLFEKLCELNGSGTAKMQEMVSKTLANLTPAVKPTIVTSTKPSERTPPAVQTKTVKKNRPIKIKVEGISETFWRNMVEKALFRVRSVVSVTIDAKREEAIVYAPPREGLLSDLLSAVQCLGMEAVHLEGGQKTPATKVAPKNMFSSLALPTYLDDDDEAGYFGTGVMTCNMGSSSLEARLAAKRKEQEQKKSGSKRKAVANMFGSLGSTFGLW